MMKNAATKRKLLSLCVLICVAVAIWGIPKLYQLYQTQLREEELQQARIEYPFLDNIVIKRYQGKDYYVEKKPYQGEYDMQKLYYEWVRNEDLEEPIPGEEGCMMECHYTDQNDNEMREVNERPLEEAEVLQVMDYEEYVDYCEEWRLDQNYTDPDMKYIVRSRYTETYFDWVNLSNVTYEDDTALLYFVEESSIMFETGVTVFIIPTDQDVDTAEVVQVYTEDEYKNTLEFGQTVNPNIAQ